MPIACIGCDYFGISSSRKGQPTDSLNDVKNPIVNIDARLTRYELLSMMHANMAVVTINDS